MITTARITATIVYTIAISSPSAQSILDLHCFVQKTPGGESFFQKRNCAVLLVAIDEAFIFLLRFFFGITIFGL